MENRGIANSHAAATAANLLANPGLEDGYYSPGGSPTGWTHEAYNPQAVFTWDNTQAHTGSHSVKITGPVPSDASWIQTVNVQPDTIYVLSGWIKTENLEHTTQLVDAGANLCLYGTWT